MKPIPVIHFGLGPIGQAIGKTVAEEPRLISVGAVDIDPHLQHHKLHEVCDAELPELPSVVMSSSRPTSLQLVGMVLLLGGTAGVVLTGRNGAQENRKAAEDVTAAHNVGAPSAPMNHQP
jgi:hypothetical protein